MTTRRHPIRFAAVGLAMSGLMALAACGGDDSGDDNDSTTTEVTAEAGDDTATEDTAADDTATDDTASDDSTDTTFDTSDVEALSAEECQELYEKFLGLGFDPTSSDEPDDPGAAFDAIEDAVPDDLKADIRVLREGYENLIEASEQYQDDVTNPEYLEAVQAVSTPEFNEASARLAAFFENCEEAVTD
jgi:hypothetical protein